MDGRNNQPIPQDMQNRELVNAVPPEVNRFIQGGVTPEQFAENARQLENYSRMNAMGLQVYLQRQSQQAEQRRQDELRVIQLAQQLASRTLPPALPPPAPPPHYHHSVLPQQPMVPRNAPVSFNEANTNNLASQHWSHVDRPPRPSVQHQQPRPTVSVSSPVGNQSIYSPHETNFGSHSVGRVGVSAASTFHTSQIAQPPKAVPTFVHQTPQYSRYSGATATSSQANSGHASASGGTMSNGVNHPPANLHELYSSWVRAYGVVKANLMAKEHIHSWRQETHATATVPYSTVARPTTPMSAQNLQRPNPFQVSKPEGAAVPPLPRPQTQEWNSFAPVVSTHGRQTLSQQAPTAPPSHAPLHRTPTNELASETNAVRLAQNTGDVYNAAEAQSHYPETATSSRVVTSTDLASAVSAPRSSQSDSTKSILLASEKKGTAPYSMSGLAASIKRSLNAERLAASIEPSALPDLHSQERKPSSSIEAVDIQHQAKPNTPDSPDSAIGNSHERDPDSKAETQPVNLVTEPADTPLTLPVSVSEASPPHEETIHTANEFLIPTSQRNSSYNFTPFSTLTGAVSFDNDTDSVPVNHNPAPSSVATGVSEDMTTSQPTSQSVFHDRVEDPLIPDSQTSFEPISFPHRTPTPPLAATITTVPDEGEVDEEADSIPSFRASTLLHEIETDSQPQHIQSGNEDDVEMSSVPGEDQVQTQPDIASSAFSQPRDNDTLMQEVDVFAHQASSLDPSIEEIDRDSMGNLMVKEHPVDETRGSAQVPEEPARVLPETLPFRVQSTESVKTSSPGLLPKLPRKHRKKQKFYIAVPPPPEWVLQAKRREAERKALIREKAGQRINREYTGSELANRLCLRHCHWNGCQAVLNSMCALKQHVGQHQSEAKPVGPAMTVSCQWKQCRMVCERSGLLSHLIRHVDKGITCIYDDCDERFSRIQDLVEHERNEHANDEPPPSALPRPPELKSPVALPQTVPSYTTTTRPTAKPSITEERHARLGPWTLGMIIGHPTAGSDLGGSNTALRVRRPTRLTDKAVNVVATPMLPSTGDSAEMSLNRGFLGQSAEYDILEEPSVASSRVFGELDSVGVTGEFYEGRGKGIRVGTPLSGTESDSVLVEALL